MSDNKDEYLYILENIDWDHENKVKYGYTKRIIYRISDYSTSSSYLHKYYKIWEIIRQDQFKIDQIFKKKNNSKFEYDEIISKISRDENKIKKLEEEYGNMNLLRELRDYLINNGGGTEYMKKEGIELLTKIYNELFPVFGLQVRMLTSDDVEEFNSTNQSNWNKKLKNNEYIIDDVEIREYQEKIKKEALQELRTNKRCYIELATGGGKTFIVFSLLSYFTPDIIICFSPRKKINIQNISEKYLNMFNIKYESYNYSDKKGIRFESFLEKPGKKIISCCIQSIKHLYEYIKNLKVTPNNCRLSDN